MKQPHPNLNGQRTAVLLVNLGTPDGFTYGPMRRYLAEFLMDKRVVDLTRWLWCPILHFIILTFRPSKAGHAYKSIWNMDLNESPLRTTTRAQAQAVQAELAKQGHKDVVVDFAMRYGQPAIKTKLAELEGCAKVIVLPLYPQYAGATVGSVADAVGAAVKNLKYVPALQTVAPYYDDSAYIKVLASSIKNNYAKEKMPQAVLASFHGLPVRYCKEGDPYFCHCHKTARLLAEELGWAFIPDWRNTPDALKADDGKPKLVLTFQSIFGKEVWLQPYMDKTLEALPEHGITRVGIIAPGFAADCVETLEEINMAGRESFVEAGGKSFDYIPCLNADTGHISLLTSLVKKFL